MNRENGVQGKANLNVDVSLNIDVNKSDTWALAGQRFTSRILLGKVSPDS
jgi:hypothetical protein